jgi:hypothetical protein
MGRLSFITGKFTKNIGNILSTWGRIEVKKWYNNGSYNLEAPWASRTLECALKKVELHPQVWTYIIEIESVKLCEIQ